MKFIQNIKIWVPVLCCTLLLACDPGTPQEANRDLGEFSNWVNQNAARADALTEAEWNELNTEFESKATAFEAQRGNWDEKTQQEWQQIKNKWAEAGRKVQQGDQKIDAVDIDLDMDTTTRQ